MTVKKWGVLLAAMMLGALVVGCSTTKAEPKTIEVKVVDMSYAPKELEVEKGS